MQSTASEASDGEEDELLKYLVVIVPERAVGGRAHKKSVTHSVENLDLPGQSRNQIGDLAPSALEPKATSQSLHTSPLPPQKSVAPWSSFGGSLASSVSHRVLQKHPSGDRHPNPDYQSRYGEFTCEGAP